MSKNKKRFYIIAAAVVTGLFLTAVEYAARLQGLELRTFAQVIKGIYMWLILPCIVLFVGNDLIGALMEEDFFNEANWEKPKNPENPEEDSEISEFLYKPFKAINFMRRIIFVIILLIVLSVAILHGFFYTFSREMVTETKLSDGFIQGTWSDFLTETQYSYYTSVAGIFRKPFTGWTKQQLTEKVQETYGADASFVEEQGAGWYVYRIPDKLAPDEYIYFHVSDGYTMENNGLAQILLSEAIYFWDSRERMVTLNSDALDPLRSALDTGRDLEYPFPTVRLHIFCSGSEEDISACAADIADWLQFVKYTGQYPYLDNADAEYLLENMFIRTENDYFSLFLHPLNDYMKEDTQENKYQLVKAALTKAFEEHLEYLRKRNEARQEYTDTSAYDSAENSAESFAQENDSDFMNTYSGDYEIECSLENSSIRYRMIVTDTALGHRLYSLIKSTDNGETWQMHNPDPFEQQTGMGIDFTFLSEDFGFASLAHNGGDSAELFVTEDGGNTYQSVTLEEYTVTLEDGSSYDPYDYPQMPYEENGILYVLSGQGADGDYAGGDESGLALYRSDDGGHTFTFVEIQAQTGMG